MKILSWNLNHRTHTKEIPDGVLSVINELSPDIIALNEYVDGDERISFKSGLNEIGFSHISVSNKVKRQNQILIASKTEHEAGDLKPPLCDEASISNFLHVTIPAFPIDVVGLRVPAYINNREREIYQADLLSILKSVAERRIVFIGDFNCDPKKLESPGARSINLLRKEGWKLPIPDEPWSYISSNGQRRSKLDYVLGSPDVGAISGTYISKVNSCIIAGIKKQDPISDHAILISEISPNKLFHQTKPQYEFFDKMDESSWGIRIYVLN